MSIKYSTNGNLALKVYSKDIGPRLSVIDGASCQKQTYRQIIDQVFADPTYGFTAGSVASTLTNISGRALCSSAQDRAFMAVTGAVAVFALFFFSFFAF